MEGPNSNPTGTTLHYSLPVLLKTGRRGSQKVRNMLSVGTACSSAR